MTDIISREKEYWENREGFEWLSEKSIRQILGSLEVGENVLEMCNGSGMFTKSTRGDFSRNSTTKLCVP